jgi:hypothetical protein
MMHTQLFSTPHTIYRPNALTLRMSPEMDIQHHLRALAARMKTSIDGLVSDVFHSNCLTPPRVNDKSTMEIVFEDGAATDWENFNRAYGDPRDPNKMLRQLLHVPAQQTVDDQHHIDIGQQAFAFG